MLCLFSFFSVCVFNHLLLLQTFVVLFTYVFVNEVYMEDDDLQEEKKTIIQNLMKHQLISRLRSEIDQGKFSYRLSDELSFMPFFPPFYFKDLLIVSKQMISIGGIFPIISWICHRCARHISISCLFTFIQNH